MTGPVFAELAWDRDRQWRIRFPHDEIDLGDLPEALAQLDACRDELGRVAALYRDLAHDVAIRALDEAEAAVEALDHIPEQPQEQP